MIGLISGDNVDGTTNILSKMGNAALREGYRNIMQHIYSPKPYYKRAMTFLREYKAPKIRTPMDFQRLVGFFRSIIRLGILGRERFQYWKILLWTFFRRPRLFPLTVTFAIYGHHFRKICQVDPCQRIVTAFGQGSRIKDLREVAQEPFGHFFHGRLEREKFLHGSSFPVFEAASDG